MFELLIVDDERIVREQLKLLFESEGYHVCVASNGEKALERFAESKPDLVVMDVMMPKINGYAAAKKMHDIDSRIPIVFLTAKDSDADEMHAFGVGAHDFISKSTEGCLLLARVKRALERTVEIARDSLNDSAMIGEVKIDFDQKEVCFKDASTEHLTETENNLLKILYKADGSFVSAESIVSSLRGLGFSCVDNMLYVHMCNLRKKLGPVGAMIVCGRTRGYKLERNVK